MLCGFFQPKEKDKNEDNSEVKFAGDPQDLFYSSSTCVEQPSSDFVQQINGLWETSFNKAKWYLTRKELTRIVTEDDISKIGAERLAPEEIEKIRKQKNEIYGKESLEMTIEELNGYFVQFEYEVQTQIISRCDYVAALILLANYVGINLKIADILESSYNGEMIPSSFKRIIQGHLNRHHVAIVCPLIEKWLQESTIEKKTAQNLLSSLQNALVQIETIEATAARLSELRNNSSTLTIDASDAPIVKGRLKRGNQILEAEVFASNSEGKVLIGDHLIQGTVIKVKKPIQLKEEGRLAKCIRVIQDQTKLSIFKYPLHFYYQGKEKKEETTDNQLTAWLGSFKKICCRP